MQCAPADGNVVIISTLKLKVNMFNVKLKPTEALYRHNGGDEIIVGKGKDQNGTHYVDFSYNSDHGNKPICAITGDQIFDLAFFLMDAMRIEKGR